MKKDTAKLKDSEKLDWIIGKLEAAYPGVEPGYQAPPPPWGGSGTATHETEEAAIARARQERIDAGYATPEQEAESQRIFEAIRAEYEAALRRQLSTEKPAE